MGRVLIVDDDAHMSVMAALLERMGHTAMHCMNGQDAIQQAEAFRPDVAFVDLAMPVMNGYNVAVELRKMCGDKLRLIAISGLPSHLWQTSGALFERFLHKPVTSSTLIALIGEVGK